MIYNIKMLLLLLIVEDYILGIINRNKKKLSMLQLKNRLIFVTLWQKSSTIRP